MGNRGLPYRRGITLLEIIISISVLSVIVMLIFPVFLHTARVIRKSEVIVDATFVAQRVIEGRYNDSKNVGKVIPEEGTLEYWDEWSGKYRVSEEISVDGKLVRIVVKVYSDLSKTNMEAQVQTSILWD